MYIGVKTAQLNRCWGLRMLKCEEIFEEMCVSLLKRANGKVHLLWYTP